MFNAHVEIGGNNQNAGQHPHGAAGVANATHPQSYKQVRNAFFFLDSSTQSDVSAIRSSCKVYQECTD